MGLFSVLAPVAGKILGGMFGAKQRGDAAGEAQEYNEFMAKKGRDMLYKGMGEQAGYDERMMKYLESAASMNRSIGARGRQDVQAMYQQGIGDVQQGLASRGLTGTTLSANLAGQMMGQYASGMGDFSSRTMGQHAASQGMLSEGIGRVGQNRMDSYVDLAQSYFGQKAVMDPNAGKGSSKMGGLFGDLIGGLFGGDD